METSSQVCENIFIWMLRYPSKVYIKRCLEAAVSVGLDLDLDSKIPHLEIQDI